MNPIKAIKAYFVAKSSLEKITQEAKAMDGSKPGYKTTEFWMNTAAQIGVVWGAIQGLVPPKWAAIISVAGAAVYTVARTITKAITDIKTAGVETAKINAEK